MPAPSTVKYRFVEPPRPRERPPLDSPDTQTQAPPRTPQSLCGTGVIFYLDNDSGELVAVPARCHRWDCPSCSRDRVAKARAQAAAGKPERAITLTSTPRPGWNLERAVSWLRDRWRKLLKLLRKHFPRLEYCAFIELHQSHWPHLHILTRGCYIPHSTLVKWWHELTGDYIVYIQKVSKTWEGVQEATKYYLKTAIQLHAEAPSVPVYTMSRDWLPKDYHDGDRPPGNYSFYGFARMSLGELAAFAHDLNIELVPVPSTTAHFVLHFTGPPPPESVTQIYQLGSQAEKQAMAILSTYAACKATPSVSLREQQAMIDYYSDPTPDAHCYTSP